MIHVVIDLLLLLFAFDLLLFLTDGIIKSIHRFVTFFNGDIFPIIPTV
jgi:hypothetical protein